MADPNSVDDLAKVGGAGGAGGLLGALLTGVVVWFRSVGNASKLEAVQAQLAEMNTKLALLIATLERHMREEEHLQADRRLMALEEKMRTSERDREEMRDALKELSEGIAR